MHAIRANFIASYSRARNLIQSDEPENPTILFSCLVLLSNTTSFSFFPLFFFRERREREREGEEFIKTRLSSLVSARRASLHEDTRTFTTRKGTFHWNCRLDTRAFAHIRKLITACVIHQEERGSLSTADFLSHALDRRLSFVSHNKMEFNVRTNLENCSLNRHPYMHVYIYILGVFQLYVEVGEPCRFNRLWQAAASNCLWSRMRMHTTERCNVVCSCLICVCTPDAILIRLQSNPGFFNRCRSTFPCSAGSDVANHE